ncbi:MAG: kelch repeat-containing protein, partial [Rhodothalassiaceae bacterium]
MRISGGDAAAAERLWGWGGPKETFNAYSGAAFDGRRLYFFGGGHHHYRGNDIKVYDLETLSWSRLYDPSLV